MFFFKYKFLNVDVVNKCNLFPLPRNQHVPSAAEVRRRDAPAGGMLLFSSLGVDINTRDHEHG